MDPLCLGEVGLMGQVHEPIVLDVLPGFPEPGWRGEGQVEAGGTQQQE